MTIDAVEQAGLLGLRVMSHEEWLAEGKALFGEDFTKWRFECPCCHNVASVEDYRKFKDAGATMDSATSECIGRYTGGSKAFGDGPTIAPCDYAGYGLFRLSPLHVTKPDGKISHCFAFGPR